jgi:hypothetical protein
MALKKFTFSLDPIADWCWNTDRQQYEMGELVLVRSDTGDGGWSLHAHTPTPGSDIGVSGFDPNPILTGPAELVDDEWNKPNAEDYREAMRLIGVEVI